MVLTSTLSNFTDAYQDELTGRYLHIKNIYCDDDLIPGEWTKSGNESVNNRPVYTRGDLRLSVGAVPHNDHFHYYWEVTSPATSATIVAEKYFLAPKCPNAVSAWKFYSEDSDNLEDDESLRISCPQPEPATTSCKVKLMKNKMLTKVKALEKTRTKKPQQCAKMCEVCNVDL